MSLTVFPSTILSFNTSSSNFTHVVRKEESVTGVTGVEDVRGVGVGMGVEMVTFEDVELVVVLTEDSVLVSTGGVERV